MGCKSDAGGCFDPTRRRPPRQPGRQDRPVRAVRSHVAALLDEAVYHAEHLRLGAADREPLNPANDVG
jgi:hypothetical protein